MNPIYQKSDINALKSELLKSKNIVITAHKSPDGDAIGSSIALAEVLKSLGLSSTMIVPDEFPEFLKWLPSASKVVVAEADEKKAEDLLMNADIIFALDYNIPHRAANVGKYLEASKAVKVMIDHHQAPGDFATYTYSDTGSCSTAQLIYEFAEALEVHQQLSYEACQAIYLGIMTDSGSFRFKSVKPITHRIVANLLDLGLDQDEIHRKVYDNNSLSRLQLRGFAISERLEILPELKTGIIHLTQKDLYKYKAGKGDTEGLVNTVLSIEGVEIAFFLREQNNEIRMSMRSTGDFSVNEFSRAHFEGGGHTNAAGGISKLSMEETINKVKTVIAAEKENITKLYA
jgi:phosphoesterase RecJ-like protein